MHFIQSTGDSHSFPRSDVKNHKTSFAREQEAVQATGPLYQDA